MNKKKRELEQNELADVLGQRLEQIKPHLPRIGMIIGALALGVIAVAYWFNSRQSLEEIRWREYFFSNNQATYIGDPRGLDKVAEMFPNSQAGQLALLGSADFNYVMGATSLVRDQEEFQNRLESAAAQYEQIIASTARVDPMIKRRATYALAYTYEALGRFPQSEKYYRQIVDEAPDSPIAQLAEKGLQRVTDQSLTSIYTAFQDWKPAETAPGDDPLLPKAPNISFPTDEELTGLPQATDADDDPAPQPGDLEVDGSETSPPKKAPESSGDNSDAAKDSAETKQGKSSQDDQPGQEAESDG